MVRADELSATRLYRGDTWRRAWALQDEAGQPIALHGASARLHLRDSAGALVLSASTADARLSLDAARGRIDMHVEHTATETLAPGSYRFALEVTHAGAVRVTYEVGTLTVLEDVTHD
jgi:hypothetical protein